MINIAPIATKTIAKIAVISFFIFLPINLENFYRFCTAFSYLDEFFAALNVNLSSSNVKNCKRGGRLKVFDIKSNSERIEKQLTDRLSLINRLDLRKFTVSDE